MTTSNLRILDASIRERLLESPEEVKGALRHHSHRPGQLDLANADEIIKLKTFRRDFLENFQDSTTIFVII